MDLFVSFFSLWGTDKAKKPKTTNVLHLILRNANSLTRY